MSEERRRHARVTTETLTCVLRDAQGDEAPFELIDLSESGARLRCPKPLPAMTRIGVALRLPADRVGRDEDVRLDTVGVVVWSHQAGESSYDTGVFFSDLEGESRALLQAYVAAAV